jgi:hypothetical protein
LGAVRQEAPLILQEDMPTRAEELLCAAFATLLKSDTMPCRGLVLIVTPRTLYGQADITEAIVTFKRN